MKATQHDIAEKTQRAQSIALGMICAAIGYSCSLTTTIYPPERYTLFALACTLAPAAYIVFRFVAHREKALDPHPLLRHCAIAMAIALLPMLFAIDSLNDALKIVLNAAPLACSGIAILGVLSLKHSPVQACAIMVACGLGWIIGSRGALYGGLNSLALHSTTALVIAVLIASVPLFPSLKASSAAHEECEAITSLQKAAGEKTAIEPSASAALPISTEAGEIEREGGADSSQAAATVIERISHMYDLSNRERDLVALIAQGADNKQIAQELFISPNTVKTHLRSIYGKLGVHSKEEIIALAHDDQ